MVAVPSPDFPPERIGNLHMPRQNLLQVEFWCTQIHMVDASSFDDTNFEKRKIQGDTTMASTAENRTAFFFRISTTVLGSIQTWQWNAE